LKICELAQGYNKLIRKNDGEEYMISPFAPVNLPLLDKSQIETATNGVTLDDNSRLLELLKAENEKKQN
jgi:hypothetical protein